MSQFYNDHKYPTELSPNIKIVQSGQTIQSIVDSCPVAAGSLKAGFTNPYVVRVPPGHEKEYYSLVRNESDEASDKRNVKVVFEDNPENKFKIIEFDDFTEGWENNYYSGAHEYIKSDYLGYDNCMHVYNDNDEIYLDVYKEFSPHIDLVGYHGFLVDVCFPQPTRVASNSRFRLRMTDGLNINRDIRLETFGQVGKAILRTTVFFPFSFAGSPASFDFSDVAEIHFYCRLDTETSPGDFYLANLRLIRTSMTPIAVLRVDDAANRHESAIPHVIEKGWRMSVSIYNGHSLRGDTGTILNMSELRGLQAQGFEFVNETRDHLWFQDLNKADTLFQYKSNQQFMRQYGFAQAANIFLHPGHSTNGWLVDKIKQDGGISFSGWGKFPATLLWDTDPFPISELLGFLADNMGGIAEIMIHFTSTPVSQPEWSNFLDYVETHFSRVILATEVLEMFPESEYKYRVPEIDYNYERVETINADMKFYNMDGGTLRITASAINLNLIPSFEFEVRKLVVINAGANTFTFDPTFTAGGNHDADAHTTIMTDSSESWSVGQLVGRTINNTPDGSSGIITDNTARTITAILSGGTSNDWQNGEAYTIIPVGLNQAVGQDQRATFVYDGEGWDITNLYDKTP